MEVNNQNLGIAGTSHASFCQTQPIVSYILTKALPILIYFLPKFSIFGVSVSFILFLILSIYEFKTVKDILGIELVGIRWFIDPDSDEFFQFYNKPAPYVPSLFESNVFWVGFFIAIAIWIVSLIFSFSSKTLLNICICAIGVMLQVANLFLFMRGQSKAQKEAAEQTRNTLLTDSVEFGFIKEGEEPEVDDENEHENENTEE